MKNQRFCCTVSVSWIRLHDVPLVVAMHWIRPTLIPVAVEVQVGIWDAQVRSDPSCDGFFARSDASKHPSSSTGTISER
jgi:hypothetical protein